MFKLTNTHPNALTHTQMHTPAHISHQEEHKHTNRLSQDKFSSRLKEFERERAGSEFLNLLMLNPACTHRELHLEITTWKKYL